MSLPLRKKYYFEKLKIKCCLLLFIAFSFKVETSFAENKNLCRNYFIQIDVLQSLTPTELKSLKTAAATLARLQQKPHNEVLSQKEVLNSQVLNFAKEKGFNDEQFAQYFALFRSYIKTTQIADAPQIQKARQQQVSQQHMMKNQKKLIDLIRKYLSVDEMQTADSDLNLALLRSVQKNTYNSEKTELEDIRMLLEVGADKDTLDENGRTPLELAFAEGELSVVLLLIDAGAKISASCMVLASKNGHQSMVEYLLKSGAKLDAQDTEGVTPLASASEAGHSHLVEFFLQLGAKVDVPDLKGQTALMQAAKNFDIKSARLLLAAGANPHHFTKALTSSLMIASSRFPSTSAEEHAQIEIVQMLLEAKADVHALNKDGETALSLATSHTNEKIIALLLKSQTTPYFQDRQPTEKEAVALFDVVQTGFTPIIRMYIEAGIDKNLRINGLNNSLLMYAAMFGVKDTAQYLLSLKVDIDTQNENGYTALHYASYMGRKDILQMLLEAGANPRLRTNKSETALSLAKQNEKLGLDPKEVIALLKASLRKTSPLQKIRDFISRRRVR